MQVQNRSRRGSMYLAVLLTAMLVAIIGMSALSAVRVQMRSAQGDSDVTAARLCAQSAIEIGFFTVRNDAAWRTKYTHDTWVPEQTLGTATFTWKLVDEQNADLAADDAAPVRLCGKGMAGDAVRAYSVLLQPAYLDTSNWLSNPGFESGTTDWTGDGICDVEANLTDPYSGTACLHVKNRDNVTAGPQQLLSTNPESGDPYEMEVWVRMKDFAENVRIVLTLDTDIGLVKLPSDATLVTTAWTPVSVPFAREWTETLYEVYWEVETTSSTQEFDIDDAVFQRARIDSNLEVISGTWQRVVDASDLEELK